MRQESKEMPSLSPEQWAGLARLGDWMNGAEALMGSPAAALPMSTVLRLGQWLEKYQLDASLEELLATLQVLRESGILRGLRDNAHFLAENAELLQGMLPSLLERIREIPWTVLPQLLDLVASVLPRLQAVQEFLQSAAGNDLVASIKRIGDLWEETRADESVIAALQLLRQLQEDGNLERIGELSRQLGLLAETIPVGSLLGQLVQEQEHNPLLSSLGALLHSGKAMAKALADAAEHEAQGKAGGLGGLYHMLKDPDVQRGMRVVAVLPIYLQKAGVLPNKVS
ncbi:MAG: DUF1641 domain-containing protein [Acidithiobacillus sp.]|nr:DUF1641 domain-containing protein [Acidithiobacillus sp.]